MLVNKSEDVEPELAASEFQELGLGAPIAISAKRGDGVEELLETVLADYEPVGEQPEPGIPIITLAGRPQCRQIHPRQ